MNPKTSPLSMSNTHHLTVELYNIYINDCDCQYLFSWGDKERITLYRLVLELLCTGEHNGL